MSRRERHRLETFARVRRGEITSLMKAGKLLGLSHRHAKRCFCMLPGGGGWDWSIVCEGSHRTVKQTLGGSGEDLPENA